MGAVEALRAVRRKQDADEWIIISAADPLNLLGTVTPEERVPALASNRILFHNGVPVATLVAGRVQVLRRDHTLDERAIESALQRRQIAPQLRAYLRSSATREKWLQRKSKAALLDVADGNASR